ncbi:SDR family NAD(P)-dependent oxidoreductase [Paraglaciecola sp.]|uniref:SDR family NAD(P)-dependent oxidoreductase n=1 Tax=Paraglaciecola sp. TaxID=1920173 RepID=UPI0030F44FA6
MKSVLITGASSGIGKSLVKRYVADGYQVYAAGRNSHKLVQAFGDHPRITQLVFDVTQLDQIKTIAEQVTELDHLILNAGDCEYMDDILHFDSQLFARVINVNLLSVAYCLEGFLAKVLPFGRVGIVSSSATIVPFPKAQAYGASKAGLDYLARSLSIDLAQHNIGVSLIQPGFVQTPLTDKNDFAMPGRISPQQAANSIFNGMVAGKHLIRFPFLLILSLQVLALLPFSWWRAYISRKTNK